MYHKSVCGSWAGPTLVNGVYLEKAEEKDRYLLKLPLCKSATAVQILIQKGNMKGRYNIY